MLMWLPTQVNAPLPSVPAVSKYPGSRDSTPYRGCWLALCISQRLPAEGASSHRPSHLPHLTSRCQIKFNFYFNILIYLLSQLKFEFQI